MAPVESEALFCGTQQPLKFPSGAADGRLRPCAFVLQRAKYRYGWLVGDDPVLESPLQAFRL
jgi:hypothetical protein